MEVLQLLSVTTKNRGRLKIGHCWHKTGTVGRRCEKWKRRRGEVRTTTLEEGMIAVLSDNAALPE